MDDMMYDTADIREVMVMVHMLLLATTLTCIPPFLWLNSAIPRMLILRTSDSRNPITMAMGNRLAIDLLHDENKLSTKATIALLLVLGCVLCSD